MNDGEDIITQMFKANYEKMEKARAKFEPIVRRVTDIDFAALYQVVMEERTRRMVRLIQENPVVRQLAIDQMVQEVKDGEN